MQGLNTTVPQVTEVLAYLCLSNWVKVQVCCVTNHALAELDYIIVLFYTLLDERSILWGYIPVEEMLKCLRDVAHRISDRNEQKTAMNPPPDVARGTWKRQNNTLCAEGAGVWVPL